MSGLHRVRAMGAVAWLAVLPVPAGQTGSDPPSLPSHWDGSRVVPVHRIALVDENGEVIVPSDPRAMPFSSRNTCGPCHDYDRIRRGFHFNAMRPSAPAGRPAQPWIWLDAATGTQIPVSYRPWPGTWPPDAVGLKPWRMVAMFGPHMPGGGPGEATNAPDPESRWAVSGALEINCLGCHGRSARYDPGEWARQVMRGNYRWAATAASGLGDVGGMASRMKDSWDPVQGPNRDDSWYAVAPSVRYDASAFDARGRAFVDIAAWPPDERCLYCHSVAEEGKARIESDADVHTRAGMACVDCHRNGLDHMTARGSEVEAGSESGGPTPAMSCRGCHLGRRDARGEAGIGGRLGAPQPAHRGFPPVHFSKLACTTCHSGPRPGDVQTRVRTSRANRLGIYGMARWDTDAPFIVERVFVKDRNGRIEPHRMMWPSFWGVRTNDTIVTLGPDVVADQAGHALDAQRTVARILAAMASEAPEQGSPVMVAGGMRFRANPDGGLDVSPCAEPRRPDDPLWALECGGVIRPLAAAVLADGGDLDPEAAKRVEAVLTGLMTVGRSGERPVACLGPRVWGLDAEGALATVEGVTVGGATNAFAWRWLATTGALHPLVAPFVAAATVELADGGYALTEDQVTQALTALSEQSPGRRYAYVSSGMAFELADGRLSARPDPAADPRSWAAAHNVRPAAHALGASSCSECHAPDARFLAAAVQARGPLKTGRARVTPMHGFTGLDARFHGLFGLTFLLRPLFKAVLLVSAAMTGLVLLLLALRVFDRVLRWIRGGAGAGAAARPHGRFPRVDTLLGWLTAVAFAALAATGLGGATLRGAALHGFWMLVHVAASAAFAIGLTGLAVLRGEEETFGTPTGLRRLAALRKTCFWVWAGCGWVLMLTIATAMLRLLGTPMQETAILVHRCAAWMAIPAGILYFGLAGVRRP